MPTRKAHSATDRRELRRRAEERLRAEKPVQPEGDPLRLVHELQVHQIQLEMQNEELREARGELESLLQKYTDLYDFAPVGYFSLDSSIRIKEVNLTGAAMLGVERGQLRGRRLSGFVASSSRTTLDLFLSEMLAGDDHAACEVALEKRTGGTVWAGLQGNRISQGKDAEPVYRLAVSDITALKRAAEAQSRMEALQAINQKLEAEVARRKETEQSLRKAKQHQKLLLNESLSMEGQLRLLSHSVLHVQEMERKSISRDLHDEIAQTLIAINMHLSILAGDVAAGSSRMQMEIKKTQKLVEQSMERVHRFAMGLRPSVLDDLGLAPALKACARDFTEQTNLPVHLELDGPLKPLGDGPSAALYRVTRAALSNIALHAKATEVFLVLRQTQRTLRLEITDNGKGFDVQHAQSGKKRARLGLIGMRERAEMVGGRFGIVSTPGKGTTITVRLSFAKAGSMAQPSGSEPSP